MANKQAKDTNVNIYKRVIGETEYVAQFTGMSLKYEMADYATDFKNGNQYLSAKKMATFLLEHIIVEPRLTLNDFQDSEELDKVIEFARLVLEGKNPDTFLD